MSSSASAAALAIDWPTAAFAPVVGTRRATRLRAVTGVEAIVGRRRDGPQRRRRGGGQRGALRRAGARCGNGERQPATAEPRAKRCRAASKTFRPRYAYALSAITPGRTRSTVGLYIVATPIGNLGDLSPRAAAVLSGVALIAAEDTRVTAKLLAHIGVKVPMTPYHDHNADAVRPGLIARAAAAAVALVSDAGTPLISDPGYKLVRDARAAGVPVFTVPGACAAVAALTLAGLPTDRFLFVGFLPAKAHARDDAIAEIAAVRATLVIYEAGPRTAATLAALAARLGDRPAAVAREITKKFEETVDGTLATLAARYAAAPPRGEVVIVVGGPVAVPASAADLDASLTAAMARAPLSAAVAEVSAALGLPRSAVYARALVLRDARGG